MANTVISLKKSAIPSATPANLANGELAINFADGKLFYRHANGSIVAFNTSGGASFGSVNANGTFVVAGMSSDILTLIPGKNIQIAGDAINDSITISANIGGAIISDTAPPNPDEGTLWWSSIFGAMFIYYNDGTSSQWVETSPVGTISSILANDVFIATQGAYDKANSANLLAYNTGIGANAFATSTISGANVITISAFNKANAALPNISGATFDGYLSITGNVGIGIANANSKLVVSDNISPPHHPQEATIIHAVGKDGEQSRFLLDAYGSKSNFSFRRAEGNTANQLPLTDGDIIGSITSFGYGSTDYSATSRASIYSATAEDWTDTSQGAFWVFETTGVGSTSRTEKMRITANGFVGIGTLLPTSNLHVIGTTEISSALTVASINVIPTIQSAYNTANSANLLAYNVGINTNNYLISVIAGANTAVGTGANSYATSVGTGSNNYLLSVIAGANTVVGSGANAYASTVGTGANNYLLATLAGANTAVGAGANNYQIAIQNGANTAVGAGANAFASATIAGANTAVGTGANNYLLATLSGANTAVGSGANTVSTAAFAKANGSLQNNVTSLITVGYTVTPYNIGTVSSGTTTLSGTNGNYQYYTNNGAHTIAAPTTDTAIDILVTNGASAGSITFSGFTIQSGGTGDAYATTNANKYILSVLRINGTSTYVWKALQ